MKDDRKHQIEAFLVKIMKTNKKMAHNDLVQEILKQMKGANVDNAQIKVRIEVLIEKEYLKRSSDNAAVYEYIS